MKLKNRNTLSPERLPDAGGHFGPYGGRFVPETLMPALMELDREYARAKRDPKFRREFAFLLREFVGRPTPLYFAERLTRELGGPKIYLKREDLCHTGAHKINNTIGQALLTRRMGKRRIIAETGAGQHGVATAAVAARFGLACDVYMGTEDMARQELNVFRMRLLGARVVPVDIGSRTLKDAISEAMRDWTASVRDTHYILGSVLGPHPYPMMIRDFQSVIGTEARRQILKAEGRLADLLVACVGGGSNAMGLFSPVPSRPVREDDRRGSGRTRDKDREARRALRDGADRRVSGDDDGPPSGPRGPGQGDSLRLRRARLFGRRSRARLLPRRRADRLRVRDRFGGA